MRLYNKTTQQIDHLVDLSRTGTCASCHAAEFHGTEQHAKAAVAKHRAISREVRRHLHTLLAKIEHYDRQVEVSFQDMRTQFKHQPKEK